MHALADFLRNDDGNFSIFKSRDRLDDNLICTAFGIAFMKFNVGGTFDFTSGVGGKKLRTVTFSDFHQTLLNTLNIDSHGIYRARYQNSLGR